jgi:hypothetical protein
MMTSHNIENPDLPDMVNVSKRDTSRYNRAYITDVETKAAKEVVEERKRLEVEAKQSAEEKFKEEYEQKYLELKKQELELEERMLSIKQRLVENVENDSNICAICYDREINACPSPCGHMFCCFVCLTQTMEMNRGCPICRQKIERITTVYK